MDEPRRARRQGEDPPDSTTQEWETTGHVRSDMKIGHLDEIIGLDYRFRKADLKTLRSGRPPCLWHSGTL